MAAVTRKRIGMHPALLRHRPNVEHCPLGKDICKTKDCYAVTIITPDLIAGHIIVSFRIADLYVASLPDVDARVSDPCNDQILDYLSGAAYRVYAIASCVIHNQISKDHAVRVLDRDSVPGIVPDLKPLYVKVIAGRNNRVR